jgi:hypothetical protein
MNRCACCRLGLGIDLSGFPDPSSEPERMNRHGIREFLRFLPLLAFIPMLFMVLACQEDSMRDGKVNVSETRLATKRLAHVSILFGHQSVGDNILAGVGEFAVSSAGSGEIVRTLPLSGHVEGPGLFSFYVGKNGDPVGKIRDFESRSFKDVDIGLMKLCYVDFELGTDVSSVFREYRDTIERLQSMYPDTLFIHVTVPVVSRETGIKALAKKVLGRALQGDEENLQRQRYNEMLRAEYGKQDTLFDLALLEATDPRGRILEHSLHGERFLSMYPVYTSDGGHLNQVGRRRVASAFIEFLAGFASTKSAM